MIFLQELIIIRVHLHPLTIDPFLLCSRTKTCGYISVHSTYHPPDRSAVQIMKILNMKFPSVNFILIHHHKCRCKRMPTAGITLHNLDMIS